MQQKLGMVVLTNGDNGLEIETALVPIVFGHDYAFARAAPICHAAHAER